MRSLSSEVSPSSRPALTTYSEEEQMLIDSVATFGREVLAPKVMEMDATSKLDAGVLKALFDNGLMGIEIPAEYGGSGMTFTQSCLAIEQIAMVDPAVAVCVDIQVLHSCIHITWLIVVVSYGMLYTCSIEHIKQYHNSSIW